LAAGSSAQFENCDSFFHDNPPNAQYCIPLYE
jgi:hypothetical protein